jgi:hypothetical protein
LDIFDIWTEGKQMTKSPVSMLVVISIFLTALGGCVSKPPDYYMLRPIQNDGPRTAAAATEQGPAIGVGPVRIPQYLDRPEIASRTSSNGIKFAEFNKWAEPLEKNLARVIADNLSVLLPSDRVCAYPWSDSIQVKYKVSVEIISLEKTQDGKAILDASWDIIENNGEKLLIMKRSKLIMPVESEEFEAVATAESRAAEALSREIAAALRPLLGEAT